MTEMNDRFTCCKLVETSLPDRESWPESLRLAMDRAVENLLEKYPEANVASDRSYCIGQESPEFPILEDRWKDRLKFALVREVILDRKVQIAA